MEQRTTHYLVILGSVLALFLVYLSGINDGVFLIDDASLIKIPQLHIPFSFKLLRALFTFGMHIDYCPVRDFSYWMDYNLFGADKSLANLQVFRVLNFVYFSFCAIFFYRTAAVVSDNRKALFLTALCFLNPIHSEMLMWVSARKDVLTLFFALASINFLATALISKKRMKLCLALVSAFFVLSLLCKPTFAVLPFAFIAFMILQQFLWRSTRHPKSLWILSAALGGFSLTWVTLFQMRIYSQINDMRMFYSWPYRLLGVVVALGKYLAGTALYTFNSVDVENYADWAYRNSAFAPAGALVLFGAFALAGVCLRKRHAILVLGALCAAAIYLPTSSLLFPHRNFYSVRYYIPIYVVLTLACSGVRSPWKIPSLLKVVLLANFAIGTVLEASNWSSELAVLDKSTRRDPTNPSLLQMKITAMTPLAQIGQLDKEHLEELKQIKELLPRLCAHVMDPAISPERLRNGDLCIEFLDNIINKGIGESEGTSSEEVQIAIGTRQRIWEQANPDRLNQHYFNEAPMRALIAGDSRALLEILQTEKTFRSNLAIPEARTQYAFAVCLLLEADQRERWIERLRIGPEFYRSAEVNDAFAWLKHVLKQNSAQWNFDEPLSRCHKEFLKYLPQLVSN